MADQNQTPGQGQGPPANGAPCPTPSEPQAGLTKPPGLMRLAGVDPSGTSYKSIEPADIELIIKEIKDRSRG